MNPIQISPYGIFEKVEADGRRFVQHCDAVAFAAVVSDWIARGRPKILLDYLHSRGEAAGWITDLRVDPTEGLLGEVDYTPPGAKSIAEKIYRFPSVDWVCGSDGRPFSLSTVALTNTPNIPVRPLSNSTAGPVAGPEQTNTPQKEKPNMEAIKILLGLEPEADEAAVIAAIEALLAKINDVEEKALEARGEAVAAANATRILNTKAFIAAYVQAPAAVEAALKTLKTPAATRVTNSAFGRTPPQAFPGSGRKFADKEEARRELAMQPIGRRQAFYDDNRAEFED